MSLLDTRHKKKSFTLTTLLLSALLLLLFYIGLTYLDPPEENGIAVNFGTMEFGSGKVQPKEKIKSEALDIPEPSNEPEQVQEEIEKVVEQEPVEDVQEETPTEKLITQESEESILIKQQREAKRKADAAAKKAKAEAKRKAQEAREAEAKKRAEEAAKKKKLDALIGGVGKSDGTDSVMLRVIMELQVVGAEPVGMDLTVAH